MLTRGTRTALFYGVLVLALILMVTKAPTYVLSDRRAHEIDDQSEALPIIVLFCAYVQFLYRPHLRRAIDWAVAGGMAAACFVVAWLLLTLDLPMSVVTLNESFIALGAMVLYAALPRPARWAPLLSLVLIALILAFRSTHFVTSQAESLVPVALMPIAFDWADRRLLEPGAPDAPIRRLGWCAFLVVMCLVTRVHVSVDWLEGFLEYNRRATEGYLALLGIHLAFAYWLPRHRGSAADTQPTPLSAGARR